ncbi:hypothetical protein RF11_15667 [Thelohanellus kitauei]|uniref:Tc1-like transposase DDE domain-containing protein n=1 Tax=Thelohanellus kitauei TaxID=669202 RepID=A0A0C2IX16_THEKT|nr:hypothetical protein RF11_15667 [Thelohanellus kitauei]
MNTKLLDIHKTKIHGHIEENPILTLNEIKHKLIEEFNLLVLHRTIYREIISINITYKLLGFIHQERKDRVYIDERFRYAQQYFERYFQIFFLNTFLPANIIYIDENWFNVHRRRSYGRSTTLELSSKNCVAEI